MNTKFPLAILMIVTCLSLQIHAQSFLTNGLVAYYPFKLNAIDATGHGYDGTFVGGVTPVPNHAGQLNAASHLNGIDACIYFGPILPDMVASTFALWVMIETNTAPFLGTLINEGDWQSGNDYAMNIRFTKEIFYCTKASYNTTNWFDLGTNLGSRWTHVVWVISTNQTSFYINGSLVHSIPVGGVDFGYHEFIVGTQEYPKGSMGWQGWWKGAVSDLRIYARDLSTNEVQQLYAYEENPSNPIVTLKKAVKPSFSNLRMGTSYQLLVSTDSLIWTNRGSPFTPTNTILDYPQYFDVENWNQLFFRLQLAP